MKKLLSLLTVLTISGTAVPTTIAASPYQKKETKLENTDINYYSQTNNLEILKRNKRENKKGFTTETLKITYNAIDFFKNLYQILDKELSTNNIVVNALENNSNQRFFVINPNSGIDYFEIPLSIQEREGFRLVFRANDFYLQGFVIPVEHNSITRQVYYYFDDAEIQTVEGTVSDENLGYNSSYTNLVNAQNQVVTWDGIYNSFDELSHFTGNNSDKNKLKKSLAQIILATSESMRFSRVKNLILSTHNSETRLNWERDFSSIINNWSRMTQDAINFYEETDSFADFAWRAVVLILTRNAFNYISPVSGSKCNKKERISNNDNEYCFVLNERVFFYDEENRESKVIYHTSSIKDYANYYVHNFNLGKINPVESFSKIKILIPFNKNDESWGVITKWGKWCYADIIRGGYNECKRYFHKGNGPYIQINEIYKNELNSIIRQNKKIDKNSSWSDIKDSAKFIIQKFKDNDGSAVVEVDQRFGINWFFDSDFNNYYIQVIVYQYLNWWASAANLTDGVKIGKGIVLYN